MVALKNAKRLVVKIGSSLLVNEIDGSLRSEWLQTLASDVFALKSRGVDILIVSSGAIALGRQTLGLVGKNLALEQSQASAAVGQIRLAQAYEQALKPYKIKTAQILVTLQDSSNRRRYLNSKATIETLLSLKVIPIVNENDTVATDEIRYGDNDRLAAQVAVTAGADQLILMSDVDGFYSENPKYNPTAKHFGTISDITPEIELMAGAAGSPFSKGGMKTKLMAAKAATAAGCHMAITSGLVMHPLENLERENKATWFKPKIDPQTAKKRWIASIKPLGQVFIDNGAYKALISGKSLLPAGVVGVKGNFLRGDVVVINTESNLVVGQGLIAYSSKEANVIKGVNSSQIGQLLGYPGRAALIHRNDMAITDNSLERKQ